MFKKKLFQKTCKAITPQQKEYGKNQLKDDVLIRYLPSIFTRHVLLCLFLIACGISTKTYAQVDNMAAATVNNNRLDSSVGGVSYYVDSEYGWLGVMGDLDTNSHTSGQVAVSLTGQTKSTLPKDQLSFHFPSPMDVTSLGFWSASHYDNSEYTVTDTTPGNNNTAIVITDADVEYNEFYSGTITFNWTGVESFTIARTAGTLQSSAGDGFLAIDNLIANITTDITWTGATNGNWNTATNWNTGTVPVSASDITIPSGLTNYPTAASAVSFNTMTINSGASFIPQSTATGAVTFNRNLPNANWYLISAPVSGESLDDVISNNTLASGSNGNLGLGYFSNVTGAPWLYAQSSSNATISNGLGISLKLANPGNLKVSGNLNTSNVIIPISSGTRNSFNLLGNPFTAYVNSATFTSDNEAFLTEKTIWVWEGTQYETYNTVSPIQLAPGQGFFVEASENNNVTFNTTNRSHQSADTFKREAPVANFELSIESEDTKSTTKVFYVAGKTTGFDNGYDSKLFSGLTNSFNVYSELVGDKQREKLAIQTLDKDDTSIIPVGVIANVGKEITFSLKSENLNEDVSIYLEDRLTGAFINVSETTYQATITEEAKGVGRFYIHTTSASLSTEHLNANIISIYKSSFNEITINGLTDEATFKMFSVTGKEVMHTRFASHGNKEITLPSLAKGVYVVQLTTEAGRINKKIILE